MTVSPLSPYLWITVFIKIAWDAKEDLPKHISFKHIFKTSSRGSIYVDVTKLLESESTPVRSQFSLNNGCQRHVGQGVHMCHFQKALWRRWRKALSLGRLCLTTSSYLIWDRQSAGEHWRHCTLQRGSPIIWWNGVPWKVGLGQCSPVSRQTLGRTKGNKK